MECGLEYGRAHHLAAACFTSNRPYACQPTVRAASPRERLLRTERYDTLDLASRKVLPEVPASRPIPSRPVRSHETANSADQSAFSVVRPPTLSSCHCVDRRGLFAYVLILYVARRSRRLQVDEGRYSYGI